MRGVLGGECGEIDRCVRSANVAGFRARECQQLIDQSGELVDFLQLAAEAFGGGAVLLPAEGGQLDLSSERRQRRPQLVGQRGAELPHLSNGLLETRERAVQRDGHFVQFVARASDGDPPLLIEVGT